MLKDSYNYDELMNEIDRKKFENIQKMESLRLRKQELTCSQK